MRPIKPMKPWKAIDVKSFDRFPTAVQPKLDGFRCITCFDDNGEPTLLSSGGRVLNNVLPTLTDNLKKLSLHNCFLDGELVHVGGIEKVQSIVGRSKNVHEDEHWIDYVTFDLVRLPHDKRGYTDRHQELYRMDVEVPGVRPLNTRVCGNASELVAYYEVCLELGYEGVILRTPDAPYVHGRARCMWKAKPHKTIEARIVGWNPLVRIDGTVEDLVGSLICIDDKTGTEFWVGSGLTLKQRKELYEARYDITNYVAVVLYQERTEKGNLRFPRIKKIRRCDVYHVT